MSSADNKLHLKFFIVTALILAATMSRLVPHVFNFSPLGAIAVFGAAYFTTKWQAILIPMAATFLSDLFLNNVLYSQYHPSFTWFYQGAYWQYAAYLLIIAAGFGIFRNGVKAWKVGAAALSATAIFFLASNFGVWASTNLYPKTAAGLGACYAAGLPFLKGTLLGDLLFCTLLFGAYELIKRSVFAPRVTPAKS